MISRRRFNQSIVTLAFTGLSRHLLASPSALTNDSSALTYGKLLKDPNGLIDLPMGFSYKVISSLNEKMTDGLLVPDRADGMGCFYLDDDRVTLIRNHELSPKHQTNTSANEKMLELAYDSFQNSYPLPGGTSNIIYNHKFHRFSCLLYVLNISLAASRFILSCAIVRSVVNCLYQVIHAILD